MRSLVLSKVEIHFRSIQITFHFRLYQMALLLQCILHLLLLLLKFSICNGFHQEHFTFGICAQICRNFSMLWFFSFLNESFQMAVFFSLQMELKKVSPLNQCFDFLCNERVEAIYFFFRFLSSSYEIHHKNFFLTKYFFCTK